MSVKVDNNDVLVTVAQDVTVNNTLVTNTITNDYPNTVTVKSNEFAVVGDGLFATTKEEVPGWMRELVGDLVTGATANAYNAMAGFNYNLYNAMIALQVAENKYQQAINTRITDQEAFVQAVETLNSTVQNAEAEIVGIKQTYATKNFATATAAQTLEASLNGGAIKSSLGQLASTMTNQYGTMAQRMDVLESTFEDLGLGVEGYANATNTLETYVGLTNGSPNGSGVLGGLTANSQSITALNAYLKDSNGVFGGATSQVANTVQTRVDAGKRETEAKWMYGSTLTLPSGQSYTSNFGMTSTAAGNEATSEFLVTADKFRLMSTAGGTKSAYSPFTVNSGDGSIAFNGKVSFSNVTNVPQLGSTPQEVVNAVNSGNTTTIDGGKITTGTIQAGAIAAKAITADKISADVFSGQTIIGGNIYGTRIEGASILGAVIKSSWIDYSNTGVLTNWQYFTPATVPSQYVDNFAKNTDGSLVVDSMGYVRLPGSNVVRTEAHSQTIPDGSRIKSELTPFSIPLRAFDYYQDDTPNRYISSTFSLAGSGSIEVRGGVYNGLNGHESAKLLFYVGNIKYEVYGYEYNNYDYTGYIKENDVDIGTTNWHRKGSIVVDRSPYGIPVKIVVNYDYSIAVTLTVGGGQFIVQNYSGVKNLVTVVEAWGGVDRAEYGTAASVNFGVFTAQN